MNNGTSVIGDGLESYTTNNLNQYTRVGGVSYGYDNSGNLTDNGTSLYEYDSENRLTAARRKSDNELIAEYEYDPFGRRTRKTLHLTPSTTNFIYDGDQVIEERDSGGAVLATYVHGAGIDECISMERGAETYYYHYDRLGSVVNLSDSSGDLAETYHYDAWGNADTYGSVENPYFFTGHRYDPETGNYYYRARYYDPAIGRFLQTDPLGYFDGPNLYTYVTNNPVNWFDPYGLTKTCPLPKDKVEVGSRILNSWIWGKIFRLRHMYLKFTDKFFQVEYWEVYPKEVNGKTIGKGGFNEDPRGGILKEIKGDYSKLYRAAKDYKNKPYSKPAQDSNDAVREVIKDGDAILPRGWLGLNP